MDDITHCPLCGSADLTVEPTMRGGQDVDGKLVFWRCGSCRQIVSRRTDPMTSLRRVSVEQGFAGRSGHAARTSPVGEPADAPAQRSD